MLTIGPGTRDRRSRVVPVPVPQIYRKPTLSQSTERKSDAPNLQLQPPCVGPSSETRNSGCERVLQTSLVDGRSARSLLQHLSRKLQVGPEIPLEGRWGSLPSAIVLNASLVFLHSEYGAFPAKT